MNDSPKKNLPASVRQRLLNLSKERGQPFDLILVRYGVERLLYRLSRSPHAAKFPLERRDVVCGVGRERATTHP